MSKIYIINCVTTFEQLVAVEADSLDEAKDIVDDAWCNGSIDTMNSSPTSNYTEEFALCDNEQDYKDRYDYVDKIN